MVVLGERFLSALVFAGELHRNQTRKGTVIPYVGHLLAVAALAVEHGADEDTAIAALLHDAVEDQGGHRTAEWILERFGPKVHETVLACTDSFTEPKPAWAPRKQTYLARLATASPEARLVTACDKLHNARSILADYRELGEELWSRFAGRREGTLWYYRAVLDALAKHGSSRLLEELERVVSEIERAAGRERLMRYIYGEESHDHQEQEHPTDGQHQEDDRRVLGGLQQGPEEGA